MKSKEAAAHFIQLAASWLVEIESMEDAPTDAGIEFWTTDFRDYIVDALRGREDVAPDSPIFDRTPVLLEHEEMSEEEFRERFAEADAMALDPAIQALMLANLQRCK